MLTIANLAQSFAQGIIDSGYDIQDPEFRVGNKNRSKHAGNSLAITCEVLSDARLCCKSHQEDVIVRVNCPNKSLNRGGCCLEFVFHAGTGIEQNSQADRDVMILAEVRYLLRNAILFHNEIVRYQVLHVLP